MFVGVHVWLDLLLTAERRVSTGQGQGASSGTASDSDGKIAVICVVLLLARGPPDCS